MTTFIGKYIYTLNYQYFTLLYLSIFIFKLEKQKIILNFKDMEQILLILLIILVIKKNLYKKPKEVIIYDGRNYNKCNLLTLHLHNS